MQFESDTAKAFYTMWAEDFHEGECDMDGHTYALFVNPVWNHGWIVDYDEAKDYVSISVYHDDRINTVWRELVSDCNEWNEFVAPYLSL